MKKTREDVTRSNKVFVGSLSTNITEKDVQEEFSKYGEIKDITLKA